MITARTPLNDPHVTPTRTVCAAVMLCSDPAPPGVSGAPPRVADQLGDGQPRIFSLAPREAHVFVRVPGGARPGDELRAEPADGGAEYSAVCPAGAAPGMLLRLLIANGAVGDSGRRVESHVLAVPHGTRAGGSIKLISSRGGSYSAVVPPGLQPGDLFEVEVEVGA